MTTKMTITFSEIMNASMGNLPFNYIENNDTYVTQPGIIVYKLSYVQTVIINILIISIGIPGIIGNGIVIRFLGFQIKRNSCTVYILNLAVADSATLILLIVYFRNRNFYIAEFLACSYCTGQIILTIISIDRCLAIFFPIWYRCHQPPYLSRVLCALAWIVSFLLCVIHFILVGFNIHIFHKFYHILIFTTICIPFMMVYSLSLFYKGYLKSWMQRREKLLTAILLALFFFLIFSFPPIIIYVLNIIMDWKYFYLFSYIYLCACLNSSVNPLIYFLLGRKKKCNSTYNLKSILQSVFKEEEENEEQPEFQADIQL